MFILIQRKYATHTTHITHAHNNMSNHAEHKHTQRAHATQADMHHNMHILKKEEVGDSTYLNTTSSPPLLCNIFNIY